MLVLILLAYGCPIQATLAPHCLWCSAGVVKAFGFDERAARDWQQRAGQDCQRVHERLVESRQHDLGQVQADEIKAKTQKGPLC
jgi:hypothetical protein